MSEVLTLHCGCVVMGHTRYMCSGCAYGTPVPVTKSNFKSVTVLASENPNLYEYLKQLEQERDKYKSAFEGLVGRIEKLNHISMCDYCARIASQVAELKAEAEKLKGEVGNETYKNSIS